VTDIKLRSLEFFSNGVRKLRSIKLEFAERFTIIAGHNGIGKSTILGLITVASGLPKKNSYFDKPFSFDINQIIHFDSNELEARKLSSPWPKATYTNLSTDKEHWKNIRLSKRPDRLRSVSSTAPDSPDTDLSAQDGKVPLPTIYLGLLRMLPIGETFEEHVQSESESSLDKVDKTCIIKFINEVIPGSIDEESENFTSLSIKYTNKKTKHPPYTHSSQSISLGQDSLSAIATAIASFNKLKTEMAKDYPGGLLVIDEVDAGFHPHAQESLVKALCSKARELSLQIIATTHSSRMIELIHPDSNSKKSKQRNAQYLDKIIYLANTGNPKPVDWSLDYILADMSLSSLPSRQVAKKTITKVYLEDQEATCFLKGILSMGTKYKTLDDKKLELCPLGIGGSNLINLPKHDKYFENVILLVDADTKVPNDCKNGLKLPSPRKKDGMSPENIIHTYITELIENGSEQYPDTYKALQEKGISSDRLTVDLLTGHSSTDAEGRKKWFNSKYKKIKEYDIFIYWAKDHPEEMRNFLNSLKEKVKMLFRQTADTKSHEK
jgi:energy-coupling factor transporter ATP-binding protein EcfA2